MENHYWSFIHSLNAVSTYVLDIHPYTFLLVYGPNSNEKIEEETTLLIVSKQEFAHLYVRMTHDTYE